MTSKSDFFRWIENEPAVACLCPRCGDMETVIVSQGEDEPVIGPECWQCGMTKERALVEGANAQSRPNPR